MDKLIQKIIQKNNPTVAGLDPVLGYIPSYIKESAFKEYGKSFGGAAAAILDFNIGLIDALCDIVPAVKPQSAYYELYGWQGVKALHDTIAYAKSKGMYVVADVKRNDIGSTAEAYSAAYLGLTDLDGDRAAAFDADAATVNGYLGTDGIAPFLKSCAAYDKDIFVLVKTSNKSSGELQDITTDDDVTIYEKMAELVRGWGAGTAGTYGFTRTGAVVGATYPRQLEELRKKLPDVFFLVPGYGAQGGGAADVAAAFNKDGLGAVINSSRAIMCAYKTEGCDEKDYAGAARREAVKMKEAIQEAIR